MANWRFRAREETRPCWCSIAIVWLRTSLNVTAAPPRVGALLRAATPVAEPTSTPAGAPCRQGSAVCQRLHTLEQGACHRDAQACTPGVRASEKRTTHLHQHHVRRATRLDARMLTTRQPAPQVFAVLLPMERRGCTRDRRRESPRDRQAPARILETGRGHLIRGQLTLLVILPQNILPLALSRSRKLN